MLPEDAVQKGLAYLRQAETADRPTFAFYLIRARLLQSAGKQAEARQDEELARRTQATIALDHLLLASAAYDAKNKAEAVKQYEAALRVEPTDYWSLLGLAVCFGDLGQQEQDFTLAASFLTGCIFQRPNQARLYLKRGDAYLRLGRYKEAEADFRQARDLRPDYPPVHLSLGNVLLVQGKPTEAAAEFRKALDLRPDYPEAHLNLGAVLNDYQRKHAEAEAEFREALRLRPDYPKALLNLGIALNDQGKHAEAARFYAQAFAAHPKLLADDPRNGLRYIAACSAVLAGCGQGQDGAKLDDAERARLRRQALDWLRADLAAYRRLLEKEPDQARPRVQRALRMWQQFGVGGVRSDALAKLPEAERQTWQQLWADVEQTLRRVNDKGTKDTQKKPAN
jgi:tetratricopeptide (TPR) repeat protein